jgi:phosphate starvation-inducible membrane PsiE
MHNEKFQGTRNLGILFSQIFHLLLLFAGGFSILWATVAEFLAVLDHGGPSLKDILMLFIFIELGAMIGIYFKTNKLSVRFLIYVAITALTRLLVVDIKTMDNMTIITITGAIVLLTISVFAMRASSHYFGGDSEEED